MSKVLVFQHVANKILGTLNPTLKSRGQSMRYINFDRTPNESPTLDKYDALIVLGGHMGVYEADKYRHINVELKLIEEALKKEIPILGICLGAQLLANVLGSEVRKSPTKEIGWCDIELTDQGLNDPLLAHFRPKEKVFQLHGDTFDIPKSAVQLASSSICNSQAFKYNDKAYGLQFHLEVDAPMILRWLHNQTNIEHFFNDVPDFSHQKIILETEEHLSNSIVLSHKTFNQFINLFSTKTKTLRLGSR